MKKQIIKQLALGVTLMGSLLAPMVAKAEEYPGGVNVYYEDASGNILNGNPEDIDSNDIVINSDVRYGLGLIQTKDELIELKDNKYNFVFIGSWGIIRYLKKNNVESSYVGDLEAPTKSIATTTYKYRYKNDPELQEKKIYALIGNKLTIDRDIIEFVNNNIITKNIPDHDLLWYYDHQNDDPQIFESTFNGITGTINISKEEEILYKYNAADDDYVDNVRRDLKEIQANHKALYDSIDAKNKAGYTSSNSGGSSSSSSSSSSASKSTRSKRSADVAATTTVGSAGTWTKEGSNWKLIKPDGSIARGWVMDNGKWYFLDLVSGNMKIGWSKDGDNWYFLNPDGSMATNWVQQGDTWYYLQGSGVMARGWIKDGNDWYFLSESGSMLKSTLTPDGYKLDVSGKWVR